MLAAACLLSAGCAAHWSDAKFSGASGAAVAEVDANQRLGPPRLA